VIIKINFAMITLLLLLIIAILICFMGLIWALFNSRDYFDKNTGIYEDQVRRTIKRLREEEEKMAQEEQKRCIIEMMKEDGLLGGIENEIQQS